VDFFLKWCTHQQKEGHLATKNSARNNPFWKKINGQPANITFTSKMAIIPVTAIANVNKMTLQTGKLYYHTAHEKQTVQEFSPT